MSLSNIEPQTAPSQEKPPTIEELQKYINTLQSDCSKLQVQLFKSEETVKKLQELNATYCKVFL